jgi:glutathione-regulated potassium-efflux system ancillary protein KefG
MPRRVLLDDLIDAHDVAKMIGLSHRNTVSLYQRRYPDMPRPVLDLGPGRPCLWLRPGIERWHARQVELGRTRPKRRAVR